MRVNSIKKYAAARYPGGFVAGAWGQDRETVTIYWSGGPVPADVKGLNAQSSDAHKMNFIEVPYSLAELRSEAKRISLEYPHVVSAGPARDYRSIVAKVDTTATSLGSVKINSVIPVVVEPSRGGFKKLYRFSDRSPFWGGAEIYNSADDALCSTGFSVNIRTGGEGILSAAHCGSGQWTTPPNNTVPVGTVTRMDSQTDSMIISGQTYGPAVYNGNWTSNSGWNVNGYIDPQVGDHVCDGGALNGEVCDALVTSTDSFINGTGPGYITDVSGSHGYGSAGEGDSGGPSYSSPGLLYAHGLIISGLESSEADCAPGAIPDQSRPCYYVIFHTNIEAAVDALGAYVESV